MHQYKGKLILHTGSMFSGKTSSLEREMKRFAIAGYKTCAFKPAMDTRDKKDRITTHDKTYIDAVMVDSVQDIIDYVEENPVDIVGIDEIQFLGGERDEILEDINRLLYDGKTVVVAGLDMDFEANPFEIVKDIMPICDYITKHHAVCVKCGSDAWVSHRKSDEMQRVVIGAQNEYEPICRNCYNKMKKNKK